MNWPWKRILITTAAMLAVLAASAIFRLFQAHGTFTAVTPGFAGTCTAVPAPTGPEDIAIDRPTHTAILSATDRRALKAKHPSHADGLYAYDYTKPGAAPAKLAGTPADFHPHGISLYRGTNGKLTLFVINHHAAGDSNILTFAVTIADGTVHLTETGISSSDLLTSPNAIAAVDESRFYVTNDHAVKSDAGRWLDDNLLLGRTNILYFDGLSFTRAADGLNFPNGVAVSKDGRYVYVAESYTRRLLTFARDPFRGVLREVKRMDIPSNLDNLQIDAENRLWIGSHPKAYALSDYRHDAAKPAPSVIYRATLKDGLPQSYAQVFADMGGKIGASSVAAFADGRLLIGSAYDTKILNCRPNG